MSVMSALSDLVENTVAFVVMIILGILAFFVTVFVVKSGASLAGYTSGAAPGADMVVLSSAFIVAASIIAGSMK